jgi:hypothetical protein
MLELGFWIFCIVFAAFDFFQRRVPDLITAVFWGFLFLFGTPAMFGPCIICFSVLYVFITLFPVITWMDILVIAPALSIYITLYGNYIFALAAGLSYVILLVLSAIDTFGTNKFNLPVMQPINKRGIPVLTVVVIAAALFRLILFYLG